MLGLILTHVSKRGPRLSAAMAMAMYTKPLLQQGGFQQPAPFQLFAKVKKNDVPQYKPKKTIIDIYFMCRNLNW